MAVTNRRGIFSLLDVRERQGAGVWSTKGDVWNTPSPFTKALPFGYFGGGTTNGSTVDRIDYSSDTGTASVKGPLSSARQNLAATGNASFGYFGGGQSPIVSTVDRIDYSNDTATAAVKGPLSVATRYGAGTTGNTSFGYFAGGTGGPLSSVDRIDYSNDTPTAAVKGPLSAGRYNLGGVSAAANALPQ